jgi:serine/threonine-protein kinase
VSSSGEPGALPAVSIRGYRFERCLGTGHFGSVYEAVDERGGRVAVKCLKAGRSAKDPDLLSRFEREARLCQALASPHIVQVREYGVDAELGPFLVMRLMRGADLQGWFTRAPLRPPAVAAIGLQVCAGLRVAHAQGVIHRDLKPENVFLDDDGAGGLTAVICDFGLAKVVDSGSTTGITSTGALLGTPYFMSPEQVLDAKRVDARTDIWALGMLLFQAIAARPALPTVRTLTDLVVALTRGTLTRLADAAPWVSPAIAHAVDGALQPLDRRWPTVDAFADALARASPIPGRLAAADLVAGASL